MTRGDDVIASRLHRDCILEAAMMVVEWHYLNPRMLAGYAGEHELPGWREIAWTARAAYKSNNGNRKLERLWLSPNCLGCELDEQRRLL